MKIILDDFYYKGQHFDQFVCEMPQLTKLEDVPEDRITDYVIESLNNLMGEES